MPRLPSNMLENVFYLYESVEAAKAGANAGGTGFFVGIDSRTRPRQSYIYAVTNWHVAVQHGYSVIRLNTRAGGSDIIDLGPHDWTFDPISRYDIAAVNLPVDVARHKLKYVDMEFGLTNKEKFLEYGIGPGDDVFMIGRFVDHDGGPTNMPAARFGHISINPTPLAGALGKVDTLCLDMNSRTGYSGSPVFVYRTFSSDLAKLIKPEHHGKLILAAAPMLLLVGIHCSQFPEWWPIRPVDLEAQEASLERRSEQIKGMSGMTCVEPTWHILDILNLPSFRERRERADALASLPQGAGSPESAISSDTPSENS